MEEVLQEYKCPACGGAMGFNSDIQKMKCPYCDSEYEMEDLKELDKDLENAKDNIEWKNKNSNTWNEEDQKKLGVYGCQSCGGEIVGDENTAAMLCPYCDNPVVMKENVSGQLKPDYVIPFKLDKETAKTSFFNHLKGKILLPKVFKDQNHIDEIRGIYVPYWLFDSEVTADLRFSGTKIRSWSDSNYRYTETSRYTISRGGNLAFEDIPADGSSKLSDDLMESIEPFDRTQMIDFQTAYLAGYLADKYDVTSEDSQERVNTRIKNSTVDAFKRTIFGYSSVNLQHGNYSFDKADIKYALYPVWILNTTWKDQKFIFAMNGQTGKFVGNLPMDKAAFWRWFAGIGIGVSGIAFIVLKLLGLI